MNAKNLMMPVHVGGSFEMACMACLEKNSELEF